MGVSEAFKKVASIVNGIKEFFNLEKWFLREPSHKKDRTKANLGHKNREKKRRRRRRDMAKMSRRINWQIAKGISIRQSR